jgi:hypothetical protein
VVEDFRGIGAERGLVGRGNRYELDLDFHRRDWGWSGL